MARPRKEPLEVMRSKILDAARHVLLQKGYQDFRISDVAERAGLASGTLYLYFKDKIALYGGVFLDLLDRLDQRFLKILEEESGLKALRSMAHEGLSFIDENEDFLFQFTGEHPALMQTEFGQILQKRFLSHLQIISRAIKQAVQDGCIRPCNLEFASIHFSFLYRMFMIDKIVNQKKSLLSRKTDEFINLFLYGLGQEKRA